MVNARYYEGLPQMGEPFVTFGGIMSGIEQEVVDLVRAIIASDGRATGSRVAAAIRERFPEWRAATSGARNLREFLGQHAPEVVVVGRAGMDVVFGPPSAIQPTPVSTAQDDADRVRELWRVWVSPNSPHILAVDRETGAVTTTTRGGGPSAGVIALAPPDGGEHRAVARGFAAQLAPEFAEQFRTIADSPNPSWWQVWSAELRRGGLIDQWNGFRRAQFEGLFRRRLQDEHLPEELIEKALKALRQSQADRSAGAPRAQPLRADPAPMSETFARQLAISIMQRMTVAELRELRLPFGVVIDVLSAFKP